MQSRRKKVFHSISTQFYMIIIDIKMEGLADERNLGKAQLSVGNVCKLATENLFLSNLMVCLLNINEFCSSLIALQLTKLYLTLKN